MSSSVSANSSLSAPALPAEQPNNQGCWHINRCKRTVIVLCLAAVGLGLAGACVLGKFSGLACIIALSIGLLSLVGAFLAYYLSKEPIASSVITARADLSEYLEYLQKDQQLRQLEDKCRTLKAQGRMQEVEELLQELHALRKQVQKLNLEQKNLTERDLDNMRALFEPPIESSYRDPIFPDRKYVMPNHGAMMNLVGDYFSTDEYTGFCFKRRRSWKNPQTEKYQNVDVLSCKRPPLQVRWATNQLGFFETFLFSAETKVQEIKQRQIEKGNKLLNELRSRCQEWGYESVHFCSEQDLLEGNFPSDLMAARDVILFFHKEIIKPTLHIEELS